MSERPHLADEDRNNIVWVFLVWRCRAANQLLSLATLEALSKAGNQHQLQDLGLELLGHGGIREVFHEPEECRSFPFYSVALCHDILQEIPQELNKKISICQS